MKNTVSFVQLLSTNWSSFVSIEVEPVAGYCEGKQLGFEEIEKVKDWEVVGCDSAATAFSVYLRDHENFTCCIGDFEKREDAETFACYIEMTHLKPEKSESLIKLAENILKNTGYINPTGWSDEDVVQRIDDFYEDFDYTNDDIKSIIKIIERNNDNEIGINYDVIDNAIETHLKDQKQ